jgi:hypothetical protein
MSLWFKRFIAAIFLGGQTIVHILKGKFNYPNIVEQMALVGPESLNRPLDLYNSGHGIYDSGCP